MSARDTRDTEEELARVLAPLRDGPIALGDRDADEGLRERIVPQLRERVVALHMQHARAERQKRKRVAVLSTASAVVAVAAMAAAALLALKPRTLNDELRARGFVASGHSGMRIEGIAVSGAVDRESADWVDATGQEHAIGSAGLGTLLPVGALELRARESAARLRTGSGAEVELRPHTRLGVHTKRAGEDPTLRLLAGEIACAVPHLGPHKQFAIETKGARVVVHGTRFTVRERVGAQGTPETCVRVQEGLVAVHHGAKGSAQTEWLKPGMQWGCDAIEQSALRLSQEQAAQEQAAQEQTDPAEQRTALRPKARSKAERGTLDAENRLLAQALRAEREQNKQRAHELFGTLLRRHPSSPLATDAAAGLERTR